MKRWLSWALLPATAALSACGAGQETGGSTGGSCIGFLTVAEETYFPRAAGDVPANDETLSGEVGECDDLGRQGEPRQVNVEVIDGVDPTVAVYEPSGASDVAGTLWVAIGETPEHNVPDEVQGFLAP